MLSLSIISEIVLQVMPGESVVLALLISAATYRSLYDFDSKHAIDPTINWRVQNTTLPKLGTTNGGNMGKIYFLLLLDVRRKRQRTFMLCLGQSKQFLHSR